MSRSFKRILRVSIVLICITIVGIGLYFLVGRKVVNLIYSDLNYAIVSGQTKMVSNSGISLSVVSADESIPSGKDEKVIDENAWSEPVIGEQYAILICEGIDLDVPVYCGDSDEILGKGAGQSSHSAFPGQGGTTLIGGHDTTFFAPLEKLREGEELILKTTYGTFTYKVSKRSIIEGSDIDLNTKEEKLILYTCYPFGDIMKDRNSKIIFECSLMDGPSIGGAGNE